MYVRTYDRALTSSPRDLARTAVPRPLHPRVQAVILAAGMGTRLGRALPKPRPRLGDGHTILSRQLEGLRIACARARHACVRAGGGSRGRAPSGARRVADRAGPGPRAAGGRADG